MTITLPVFVWLILAVALVLALFVFLIMGWCLVSVGDRNEEQIMKHWDESEVGKNRIHSIILDK